MRAKSPAAQLGGFRATLNATIAVLREGAVGGGATVDFDGRLPLWAWVMLPIVRGGLRFKRLAAGCYL